MREQFSVLRIQRKPGTLDQTGWSDSTYYNRIKDGLFVSPFSLGGRAVGILEEETTTIIAAMAAGEPDDVIRAVVKSLHDYRKRIFEKLTSQKAILSCCIQGNHRSDGEG